MKTTLISPKTEFQPITIEVTFETLQEAELVGKMLRANMRIPDLLCKDTDIKPTEEKVLTYLMDELYKPMLKGILRSK